MERGVGQQPVELALRLCEAVRRGGVDQKDDRLGQVSGCVIATTAVQKELGMTAGTITHG